MSTFLLEIITPARVAYRDTVDMVTAPSASGVVGILPHHVPLFTRLVEGEVKFSKAGEDFFLAIGGGFMEVTGDHVVILVSQAQHAHELNEEEIKRAEARAKDAIAKNVKGVELAQAQALLRRSMLELKVLRRRRGRPAFAS